MMKVGDVFIDEDGYRLTYLGKCWGKDVFRVGDTERLVRHSPERWEDYLKRERVSPLAEPDDREGLVEAARNALKYMGHLPTCDFGNDTPDGDFCTCKFAEAKRALRDRLQEADG